MQKNITAYGFDLIKACVCSNCNSVPFPLLSCTLPSAFPKEIAEEFPLLIVNKENEINILTNFLKLQKN